ncbi:division/cell wall cluster transcriptional repressor MraZ [Actinomyces mediterranea]|uniref:division/cell wall cluster transcriptional repressor MraZ n=1 Tax=Actinomyces mediterranea TaxID=1871028 RepID=UPI000970B9B7|nr:division/cell wall cluster transcriptional repressor MraZ [Actinomyces mediterranea]
MFLGTYEPKLDDKGRVFLPAKFREDMEGGIVLTRGQEHCIYAFPAAQFDEMTKDMIRAPLSHKQARDWSRVMLSGAYKEVPDKQGRISLPADLRAYAGLDRELTVIGAGLRAEIWNSSAWRDYLAVQEDVFAQTEEQIIPGVF